MKSKTLLTALVFSLACSGMIVPGTLLWAADEQPARAADKVVALWVDTVLFRPTDLPIRGFGGRLYFYRKKEKNPIKVDGTLMVYAFDESDGKPDKARPGRKFVFIPEQFAKHYCKSDVGHSYSVWLPWDAADGPQKEISLTVRFVPRDGPVFTGRQTKHILPGRATPPTVEQRQLWHEVHDPATREQPLQRVSYEARVEPWREQTRAYRDCRRERTGAAFDSEAYKVLTQAAQAYRTKLSVIANNLANAETTAFKRSCVVFDDLPCRHERTPGAEDSAGQYAAFGISVGGGVRVAGTQTDFRQGTLQQTGRQLDVAVEGRGFFQVMDPNGDTLYTRAGNFSKNANGDIVMGSANAGRRLEPPITIPEDATALVISSEGIVSVRQPGSQNLSQIGQIELAMFVNPQGLLKRGENLYAETDACGAPALGNPGQDGLGTLRQGALEASNVDVDQEHIEWNKTARMLNRIRRLLQAE